MRIDGTAYRTIWSEGGGSVAIIDQTRLPHDFAVVRLTGLEEAAHAPIEERDGLLGLFPERA
ncbi:protein of unknown function [Azospirillum lipoferum 4B]|uniref:Uncharacterized protein n=1 Tax=Azospirillum lipoferum (strain 4B) TaxID=862719 RepID=G7Z6B0_AZOL4|nr:protein of unknown function [Azospirillum lipoferum 4B]